MSLRESGRVFHMTTSQSKELGSFGLWLLKFLVLGLFLVITAAVVVVDGLGRFALLMFLLFISGLGGTDSLAYGYANDKGIVFRRFVKKQFLPWEKVAAVRWVPGLITLHLKGGRLLRCRLDFPATTTWNAIAELLGRRTPEIVSWLDQQIKAGRPEFPHWRFGYEPWKDSLPMWLAMLILLFALVFIIRLGT